MPQAVWWVFVVSASFVSALILKALFTFLLVYAGLNLYVILPLVVVALGIIFINGLFWLTLGKAVYMFLIVDFYREIAEMRYEEMSTIDIGSWFSKDFSHERIATLENITLWLRNLISHDEHVLGINPLL